MFRNLEDHPMLKKLLAVLVLLVGVGVLMAAESKGKFKAAKKGTITITVGGKDVDFKTGKGMKVYDGDTEVTKKDRKKLMQGLKAGDDVIVIHEDGVVKEFKVKK